MIVPVVIALGGIFMVITIGGLGLEVHWERKGMLGKRCPYCGNYLGDINKEDIRE